MDYIGKFAIKFIFLTVIAIVLIVAFTIVLLLMMKVKRADYYRIIQIRQTLIVFIASVFFWGIGGVIIGTILWMIFFVFSRKYIFAIDARRLEELYMQYEKKGREYPLVEKSAELINVFFNPAEKEVTALEWKYSFSKHLNSLIILLILCFLEITTISSTVLVIYVIEFLIVATAGYILISKLVYYLARTTPSSIFFLCPKGSYIPVILLGVLYYSVTIIMLLTILGVV